MKAQSRLFFIALIAALAGFIFGFDTIVVSGAEQSIQKLWKLSDLLHGMAIGSALYGTVLGAFFGSWPTEHFGRKKTLLCIGSLYFISAMWSGLATDVYSFIIARFLGGVGIGISTVAAPLYISEISPPAKRGRMAGMFQFNIVFGILVAYFSNMLLAGIGEHAWRWMLGVEAIPAAIYTLLCFIIPESPRWLIGEKQDRAKGLEVLRLTNPDATEAEASALADEIANHYGRAQSGGSRASNPFWSKRLTIPIFLAIMVAFFNQLSGINAILYFAPRIFEMTGLAQNTALLQSIGIGVTNLVFTLLGLWLIDRVGRKTLLYIGSFGYIISLGLVSWAFYSKNYAIVPTCIFAFIAAHAVGQGAVIWVLISEIFPNEHRAAGQSLGSSTHWIFAALLTSVFPKMVSTFHPATIFLFFTGMMVLQLLWVFKFVPETKGIPLEEIEEKLGMRS
ncbi:sugar porter family MFS transporter [Luteolibacter pohnpeiensis]|uniref:Sugar porter family MFS transporter n=1 Tax=Luteolibacter pohnpeiensis TaxID=454153 RepID=A0A934S8J3_9BACT|nr:sugar porter family MFS transporter [Luteolibacter pohnpeiensis]MBK1880803.1 sugar porter family MFS transporter [Luteolibacter pohnpeiensis]